MTKYTINQIKTLEQAGAVTDITALTAEECRAKIGVLTLIGRAEDAAGFAAFLYASKFGRLYTTKL